MVEQILESLSALILNTIETGGYWGVFLLMAIESANIPIPSEIIMPFSGFLVSAGVFRFWPVVLMGALGNLGGSMVSYYIAVYFGKWTRSWAVKNPHFNTSEKWFNRHGAVVAFWSRLMPIVRTFISFPAGLFRISAWRFFVYTFCGSFVWSAILTYPGVYLGENWQMIEPLFRKFDILILAFLLIGFILMLRTHLRKRQ
ncbi:MAG: DedA family protein [Candidatus Colwellbacteria bacterium]|nr:DedA family protein [Candidatus Colwellbacteria bacterium]